LSAAPSWPASDAAYLGISGITVRRSSQAFFNSIGQNR
jgi:hypothetical protein